MSDLAKEVLRTLMPPYLLDLGEQDEYNHYLGGKLELPGGHCPYCKVPLQLYMHLDLRDPRLVLDVPGWDFLPVLFCQRCQVGDSEFAYRLHEDQTVEIVDYKGLGRHKQRDPKILAGWLAEGMPDYFPRLPFRLRRMPQELEELYVKYDYGFGHYGAVPDEDYRRICELIDSFNGGYPQLIPPCQVGGYGWHDNGYWPPFTEQGLPDPATGDPTRPRVPPGEEKRYHGFLCCIFPIPDYTTTREGHPRPFTGFRMSTHEYHLMVWFEPALREVVVLALR